jgi:hypothetical protein
MIVDSGAGLLPDGMPSVQYPIIVYVDKSAPHKLA